MPRNDKTPPDRAGHCQSCDCDKGQCKDTAPHPRSQAYIERIRAALERYSRRERGRR